MKYLVLLLSLYSYNSYSCQYSTNSNELDRALNDREAMRLKSQEIASQSDEIFIGTVKEVNENTVVFVDIAQIKGTTKEQSKFTRATSSEITVGCSGLSNYENLNIPENQEMNDYLVYAKGGTILRINKVSSFAESPSGYEEIEWLGKKPIDN